MYKQWQSAPPPLTAKKLSKSGKRGKKSGKRWGNRGKSRKRGKSGRKCQNREDSFTFLATLLYIKNDLLIVLSQVHVSCVEPESGNN